jgi:hypothetical protein
LTESQTLKAQLFQTKHLLHESMGIIKPHTEATNNDLIAMLEAKSKEVLKFKLVI